MKVHKESLYNLINSIILKYLAREAKNAVFYCIWINCFNFFKLNNFNFIT